MNNLIQYFQEITEDEPTETFLSLWLNKILGMVVCIKCNVLVIYGIRKNSPNFLIPWLAVYLLGTILSTF